MSVILCSIPQFNVSTIEINRQSKVTISLSQDSRESKSESIYLCT